MSHGKAQKIKLGSNELRGTYYRFNDFQFLMTRGGWLFSSKHSSFKLSLFIKYGQHFNLSTVKSGFCLVYHTIVTHFYSFLDDT